MKKTAISILLLASIFMQAQQYNYNFEQFGNKSTLLLGNVTAGVNDLALSYYNPSRLAFNNEPKFELNARAYRLRKFSLEGVDENNTSKTNSNFSAMPSMAAGTFNWKGEKFVYSFISKVNSNNSFGLDLPAVTKDYYTSIPGSETYKGNANVTNAVNEELIGLTWAKKITDNFSVGVTGFASIYKSSGSTASNYVITHSTDRVAYLENRISFEQKSWGLTGKVGMSYLTSLVDFGLNVNLPYLEARKKSKFNYKYVVAGIDSDNDWYRDVGLNKVSSRRKTPLGIDFGAKVKLKKNSLHLKTSWYDGMGTYDRIDLSNLKIDGANYSKFYFQEKLKSVFNYGAAAEIYVNDKISTYAAFSTDFSPVKVVRYDNAYNFNTNDLNLNADFYHYSLGLDIKQSWANIFLGATYSRAKSSFDGLQSLPEITGSSAVAYKSQIWKFMAGIEIPLFNDKVKKLIDKVKN